MANTTQQELNIVTLGLENYGKAAAGFLYDTLFSDTLKDILKREQKTTREGETLETCETLETLNILYVGKRSQKAFLVPLLAKIAQKYGAEQATTCQVNITTIVHAESENFFSKVAQHALIDAETLKNMGVDNTLKVNNFPSNADDIKGFSFAVPLESQHTDAEGYFFKGKNPLFHIIFCCWEFHLDLNWRLAHTYVLKFLKAGGALVFTKATGDFSIFDGNFKDESPTNASPLSKIMRLFDNERNENHFFWNPEISMSDYYQMRKQLEFYFKKVVVHQEKGENKHHLEKADIKNYFEKQLVSYLKIGLTTDFTSAFVENEAFKALSEPIEINKPIQYYIANDFMPDELENIASWHWRYDDLIKKLQELNDNKPEKLSRKALDSLVSHDIFFPKHTISCSFFYWLSNDTDYWDYPVHIVNNHILDDTERKETDIYKQFLELMTLESLNKQGVFRYLIRDIRNKMQISFQFYENTEDVKELTNKGYQVTTLDRLAYKVKYDKKRKPVSLKLAFTKHLFNEKSMAEFVELMNNKTNEGSTEIPVNALEIREKIVGIRGNVKRFSILEAMQKKFEDFENKHKKDFDALFEAIANEFSETHPKGGAIQESIKSISDIINQGGKKNEKSDTKEEEAALFLRVFISIALFIWETKDFELSFYPSAAVENESNYSEGLGGIVVSEKLFSLNEKEGKLDPNQINLFVARNNALVEASNQIFYKIGISDHVNYRYQTFAQQSAVATIISRNGSHGIGSHAIPSLINDHRDLWQHGDKTVLSAALRDDDIFYKYLQDRFEFITQLGNPSLPKWTLTTWFGKDLMKRFLMQRHLLNNLASSERLQAFEFLEEGNWDNSQAIQTGEGEAKEFMYGTIQCINKEWFISEVGTEGVARTRQIEWAKGIPPQQTCEGKVRVSGKLSVKNGTAYLKDAALETGRILIKVRLRQFLAYDDYGVSAKEEGKEALKDTSNLISDALHVIRCADIDELNERIDKIEERKLKKTPQYTEGGDGTRKQSEPPYYYGVICKTYEPKTNEIKIRLGKSDAHTVVLKLKNTFADDKKLHVGGRLIFTGEWDKSGIFTNVVIKELVFNKNIIHPKEYTKTFEKDLPVSIVGGIVGYQAFYSILENIIRNAAKHNWQIFDDTRKQNTNLIVNIEIEDQLDEDHYICKIWTNTTDVGFKKGLIPQSDAERANKISVFSEESLVEQLRKKLESPIIDSKGKPKQEDIGVSEIKICAAFLAGKDWTLDPKVLSGKNAILKHKPDRSETDTTGYIRTFVAWDSENAQLTPRLGYRFRLLKAKEFLFFTPNNEEADKETKENIKRQFSIGKNSPSKIINYNDDIVNLDYDCCVLVVPKEEENALEDSKTSQNRLLASILKYANDKVTSTIDDDFMKETIRFPHRLLVVCPDADNKIKYLKQADNKIGNYLKKRVAFVDRALFDKELQNAHTNMPLWLYNQWVCFLEGSKSRNKKELFELFISLGTEGGNVLTETDRMNIPTLPFSLRGDAKKGNQEAQEDIKKEEANLIEKLDSFNAIRKKWSSCAQKEVYVPKKVEFVRHATYDKDTHFSESLSGGKISFSTFANIQEMEETECNKFFMQLMESAQNFTLVLDERLMEFVAGNPEKYAHFEKANILIPTEFHIQGKSLHKEAQKEGINGIERELNYENNRLKVLFNQQEKKIFKGKNGKDGRITTVIIHQTLLEKIVEKGAGRDENEPSKNAINDFIRWLKVDKGIPSVIITSGRGKNNNTSDLAKFIPFSDISSLLMQYYPEKWMLNRIIAESLH